MKTKWKVPRATKDINDEKLTFEVLNRFTGVVQFTAEIDCDESEAKAAKLGLAVKWAIKNGANLSGANLSGANLNRASLNGANLNRASLNGANLNRASLNGANLNRASLIGASLACASLARASLARASLIDAILNGANLNEANLNEANLNGANLNGADTWGVRGNNHQIKSIHITKYDIAYTCTNLQIGCEKHSKTDWLSFSDGEIDKMAAGALEWWKEWKPKLITIGVFDGTK